MNALEILISEIEHTAELALSDGSKVTRSKLNAHLRQYGEAIREEKGRKPATVWNVAEVKRGPEETWVRLTETQYVADEPWPKVGQELEEVR